MKNINLNGADFEKVIFEKKVHIGDATSVSYALFNDAHFNDSAVFEKINFEGITDFSCASFQTKNEASKVRFENVNFDDVVNFSESIFDSIVLFKNIRFCSNTDFIDTAFNISKSTSRYRTVAVKFSEIEIQKDAELNFISTNSQNKLFKQDVSYDFRNEVKGIIRFENANFKNIIRKSQKELIRLSRLGRVEIRQGCIKYRFQTETKTININGNNQLLLIELTQTFTNYFTVKNGLNLGFEIVERDNDNVSFFYFTDENITESEFFERLMKTERDLWNLVSPKSNNQNLITYENDDNLPNEEKESMVINTIDGLSALMSTFFRVAIRISFGKWKEKDTKALTDSININNQQPSMNPLYLHQTIINHYNQNVLFGIKNRQILINNK